MTKLNTVEEEVIFLNAVVDIIDSIVNFEVLELNGNDPNTEVSFRSWTHQKYFSIILVDFLSCTDEKAPPKKQAYLKALRFISEYPSFNIDNSVASLTKVTHEFVDWLEQEVNITIWLPSINAETTLNLKRLDFLKMCGNISKHNFLRSVGVANKLKGILSNNGISIELDEALIALSDFYHRFHDDILNYHASTIVEFLNNIRWSIFEYLQPQLHNSIVWESHKPLKYTYIYPEGIVLDFTKECYRNLMNNVSSPPYLRKFEATRWLKLRY